MVVLEAEAAIAADCLHFSSFAFDLIFQEVSQRLDYYYQIVAQVIHRLVSHSKIKYENLHKVEK